MKRWRESTMAKVIEYLPGARRDFDESFDWYAKRSARAAIGFVLAVERAIESIVADSDRFPRTYARCRYCLLKRYPFSIVYRVDIDRLVVIAVAHAKRRPGYWRNRK
jgi:plasmid stabilization system protein ParE